jgi:hypothetical protein
MIGDRVGEEIGQVTGRRVLPDRDSMPVMEISVQQSGELYGVHVNDIGTYESVRLPNGRLAGKGRGVLMTQDGETVSWKATGLGRFVDGGIISWLGALIYRTDSVRLARLNEIVGLFEYEVDESGKTAGALWEWT